MPPRKPICFGVMIFIVKVTGLGTDSCLGSGKMPIHFVVIGSILGSLEHNLKSLGAINLALGTDTCLGSGKIPIHFGVTECKKLKLQRWVYHVPALLCYIWPINS